MFDFFKKREANFIDNKKSVGIYDYFDNSYNSKTINPKNSVNSVSQLAYIQIAIKCIYEDVYNTDIYFSDSSGNNIDRNKLKIKIRETLFNPESLNLKNMIAITAVNMLLSGNAVWFKTQASPLTQLFWILSSENYFIDCVNSKMNRKVINITLPDMNRQMNSDEYIHFIYQPLHNAHKGLGILESARLEFENQIVQRDYEKESLKNAISLKLLAIIKGVVNEQNVKTIEKKINAKYSGADGDRIGIFTGVDDIEFKTLDMIPAKDLDFIENMKFSREKTLALFGVTLDRAGIADNSSKLGSSGKEQLNQYYKNINSILSMIEETINAQFIQKIDSRIKIVLKKYPTGDIESIKTMIELGIMSPKQAALSLGLGYDMPPEADVFYMSSSLVPMQMLFEQPKQDPQVQKEIERIDTKKINKIPKSMWNLEEFFLENIDEILDSKSATHPKMHQIDFLKKSLKSKIKTSNKFLGVVRDYLEEEKTIFIEEWEKRFNDFKKLRKKSEEIDAFNDIFSAVVLRMSGGRFKALHTSSIQSAMRDISSIYNKDLNSGLSNVFVSQEISRLGTLVKRIDENTRKNLEKIIINGVNNNLNTQQIQAEIEAKFEQFGMSRAHTIARTESRIAYDAGAKVAYTQLGVEYVDCVGCRMLSQWAGGSEPIDKSTCGRQKMSVNLIDNVPFHPNHVGCWAPHFDDL